MKIDRIAMPLAALALLLGFAPERTVAAPQDAVAPPAEAGAVDDGPVYDVRAFRLAYVRENPLHPDLGEIASMPILLGRVESGWVAPRPGIPLEALSLDERSAGDSAQPYHASAIQRILEALRDAFIGRDLFGVSVGPDPRQIGPGGADLRPAGASDLVIVIATGVVTELRTRAAGPRVAEGGDIAPDATVDHPLHRRHVANSPVAPHDAESDDPEAQRDLLRRSELDRYIYFLGRHPGRIVELEVAAADTPGTAGLDYVITENKPLVIYGQVGNTGTSETDYMRYRVGLLHTQLTENDDILGLDYQTNFGDVNSVLGSYERPFSNERVRWQINGLWSEYTASDVGAAGRDFVGETYGFGGQVIWNFFQERELFLDLVVGMRYENDEVNNRFFDIQGQQDFLIPFAGVRIDRTTNWFSTQGAVIFDWQGDFTDIDPLELAALGRTLPDDQWVVARWSLSHSFYLEPLIDRAGWEDPTTPESSTLAHEILLRTSGQYSFGSRLTAQAQGVAGGLNTVRGYPESAVAGDDVYLVSAEYRYHLPRAFNVQPKAREMFGEPFRAAPQYVYGFPDWDLVLKGFVDAGWTQISDPLFFEQNESLVGAGVGVDFFYRRQLSLRVDWGFVLSDLESRNVDAGSNRLQFVATIYF